MVAVPQHERLYSVEDFLALDDVGYELDDGVLLERCVSNLSSLIALKLGALLLAFVEANRLGLVFGTDAMLQIFPDRPRRIPRSDIAFVRRERVTPDLLAQGTLTIPPDLIVEVVSKGDTAIYLQSKVGEYLTGGVGTVWVVYPDTRQVVIHRSGSTVTLGEGDTLDGGEAVPGFSCRVATLVPDPL